MAKLGPPIRVPEWEEGQAFDVYSQRQAARYAELKAEADAAHARGQLRGELISFPVGDGRAIYQVASERPLTLRHVPLGDGYRIEAAHVRGLDLADVRRMVRACHALDSLFSAGGQEGGVSPLHRPLAGLPLSAWLAASQVHPEAMPYGAVQTGQTFYFPSAACPCACVKLARGWYLPEGTGKRCFRTGSRTAVVLGRPPVRP